MDHSKTIEADVADTRSTLRLLKSQIKALKHEHDLFIYFKARRPLGELSDEQFHHLEMQVHKTETY